MNKMNKMMRMIILALLMAAVIQLIQYCTEIPDASKILVFPKRENRGGGHASFLVDFTIHILQSLPKTLNITRKFLE